jgi:hypothetical protein
MQEVFKSSSLHPHMDMIHPHTLECYLEHNTAQTEPTDCCSKELGVWAIACAVKSVSGGCHDCAR